jgi:hypothetical protein
MMTFSTFDLVQWFTVIVLELAVFMLATRRHVWKHLPAFYVYAWFTLARSLSLVYIAFAFTRYVYFYAWWYTEAAIAILQMSMVVELATHILKPGRIIPRGAFSLLTHCALASTAIVSAVYAVFVIGARSRLEVFIALNNTCRLVCTSMIACTLLFTAVFSVRWKPLPRSIAAGTILIVGVTSTFDVAQAYFPGRQWQTFWLSNSAAHSAALLLWVAGLFTPSRSLLVTSDRVQTLRGLLRTTSDWRENIEKMAG